MLNSNEVFAWTTPAGRLKHITIAATAGNVTNNTVTPSVGKRYIVLSGRIRLVADGNAANRIITLTKLENALVREVIGYSATITAGQTRDLNFGEGRVVAGSANLGDPSYGGQYLGISPIILDRTDILSIAVVAGLVGDSYSGYVTVLELDM